MVYSTILKLLFATMFHNKLILTSSEGSKFYFPLPLSSMTDLFSTLNYRKITTYKQVFKEVSIGQAPEQIVFYYDLKCIRRQYGLRHYVNGNIHGEMGDTYNCMAISVRDTEQLFSLCDHGQLIVILSRTRIIKILFLSVQIMKNFAD